MNLLETIFVLAFKYLLEYGTRLKQKHHNSMAIVLLPLHQLCNWLVDNRSINSHGMTNAASYIVQYIDPVVYGVACNVDLS